MALIQWKQISPHFSGSGNFTGSLNVSGSQTLSGDLVVGGVLTAREYHSEVVSASMFFESGSSVFGNSLDDTHLFTGSVKITGSLVVNGADLSDLAAGLITGVEAGAGLSGGGTIGTVTLTLDTGSAHFTEALAALATAGIFKQTGSVYSTTNDLEVTGSMTLQYNGSRDPFQITSGSTTTFSISGDGVLTLTSQSGTPTPRPGGIYFGSDGNFYFGS